MVVVNLLDFYQIEKRDVLDREREGEKNNRQKIDGTVSNIGNGENWQ